MPGPSPRIAWPSDEQRGSDERRDQSEQGMKDKCDRYRIEHRDLSRACMNGAHAVIVDDPDYDAHSYSGKNKGMRNVLSDEHNHNSIYGRQDGVKDDADHGGDPE